ncbi:MAG: stage II sporulation protein R [Firmicutes bacterium]|nr:stage II sporulation protein R [Bacillota bacterium]
MKTSIIKTASIILAAFVVLGTVLFFTACDFITIDTPETMPATLRFHIRANSNTRNDQTVKYQVRDSVVEFLNDELGEVQNKQIAKNMIRARLRRLENIANGVLAAEGFSYKATARLSNEFFPTRVYGNTVFESGFYYAVVMSLGEGNGNNWWCVIYPPLCYFESKAADNFQYRSFIMDIINRFRRNQG